MKRIMLLSALIAFSFLTVPAQAQEKTYRTDHVIARYSGVGDAYPKAMATTSEDARAIAIEKFGFSDMPDNLTVTIAKGNTVRLFTDGHGMMSLTVRSERDLRKPMESGTFNLYGACHEVGHIAMYRLIKDQSWLTTAACEGWAHYLGSRIVDEVYVKEGSKLWPDAYDYRRDGMSRLNAQIASGARDDVTKGAALWKDLVAIVGDKGVEPIFTAWGKAKIEPDKPGAAVGEALFAANSDPRLKSWWKKAEPVLILVRPKSGFAARTAAARDLSGKSEELSHDDGKQANVLSSSGSGHAVRFEVDGDSWYLTAVKVYGARYGMASEQDKVHVWLCDGEFMPIAEFTLPYTSFMGAAKWVTLPVSPTSVPRKFVVCVAFNPTARKGVFVGYDKAPSGDSLSGLPGKAGVPFRKGDWMIRAVVVAAGPHAKPGLAESTAARAKKQSK